MTDLLVQLLKETPKEEIDRLVYLTSGKVHPDYMGIELGLAETLAATFATKADRDTVERAYNVSSDLGEVARASPPRGCRASRRSTCSSSGRSARCCASGSRPWRRSSSGSAGAPSSTSTTAS